MVGMRGVGWTIKGWHEGHLCGDRRVLYHDCGGELHGSTQDKMTQNCAHMYHCQFSSYCAIVILRYNHGEKLG